MTRFTFAAAAAAVAFVAAPAMAQDVGTTIMGNDDAAVGTVISNDGTIVVVDTGSFEAPLPAELIGNVDGVFSVNATKAQIDGMMEQQVAQQAAARAEAEAAAAAQAAANLEAALVVGAAVVTVDNMALGTVSEFIDAGVVVEADGQLITLPRNLFAADAEGNLMALANHADIMAAVNGG